MVALRAESYASLRMTRALRTRVLRTGALGTRGVRTTGTTFAVAVLMLLLAPGTVASQQNVDAAIRYEREVFRYPAGARPDPFRSLLQDGDLGIRIEDVVLRGIVSHSDPSLSVAVLTVEGSDRRIQARVGERVGPLRVLAIYPDRVEIVVEELGVARRETLRIARPEQGNTRQ